MAEFQLPKLATRVRFPSPAPSEIKKSFSKDFFYFTMVFPNGNDIRFTNDIANAMIFSLARKCRKYHIIICERK